MFSGFYIDYDYKYSSCPVIFRKSASVHQCSLLGKFCFENFFYQGNFVQFYLFIMQQIRISCFIAFWIYSDHKKCSKICFSLKDFGQLSKFKLIFNLNFFKDFVFPIQSEKTFYLLVSNRTFGIVVQFNRFDWIMSSSMAVNTNLAEEIFLKMNM